MRIKHQFKSLLKNFNEYAMLYAAKAYPRFPKAIKNIPFVICGKSILN